MSTERITREIDKIVHDKKLPSPKNFALATAWILADLKGVNLKILDMRKTSSLADYYVLVNAENTTTARSMTERVQFHLKRHQLHSRSVEGVESAEWILIDCGDIIIHILQETSRDIFDLDNLWRENPIVPIPQEYYFSHQESVKEGEGEEEESTDSYFS